MLRGTHGAVILHVPAVHLWAYSPIDLPPEPWSHSSTRSVGCPELSWGNASSRVSLSVSTISSGSLASRSDDSPHTSQSDRLVQRPWSSSWVPCAPSLSNCSEIRVKGSPLEVDALLPWLRLWLRSWDCGFPCVCHLADFLWLAHPQFHSCCAPNTKKCKEYRILGLTCAVSGGRGGVK